MSAEFFSPFLVKILIEICDNCARIRMAKVSPVFTWPWNFNGSHRYFSDLWTK